MNRIKLIHPQVVSKYIGHALPLLDIGLKRMEAEDKYPLQWVVNELLSGRSQLWMLYKEDKLAIAVVTNIKQYPSGKWFLELFLTGGTGMESFIKAFYEKAYNYAREMGCTMIALGGRPGWGKVFKQLDERAQVESLIKIDLEV